MAMQLWGVWMALGVWAARRAELLLQTASDAQSLVVAFATGSPLDSVSRKTVLTNPRKAKWQRRANELLQESNQQPALLTTAVTVPMHEPEAPTKPALNEKELREIAASKARAELWELSRDLALIARYNARKAAEAGAKKVMLARKFLHTFLLHITVRTWPPAGGSVMSVCKLVGLLKRCP